MADTPNSLASFNAMLKLIYPTEIADAVTSVNHLQKRVKFNVEQTGPGLKYHLPVKMSREQGSTFSNSDVVTLNASRAPTIQYAELAGSTIAYNSTVTQKLITSTATDRQAFERAMDEIMKDVIGSMGKRTENSIIHGSNGYANASSSTNINTTSTTLNCTAAMWAGAMWQGEKGMPLDLLKTAGTVVINTNAPLVLVSVDYVNHKLVVSGNATDIAAVDTYCASNTDALVVPFGALGNEMVGLRAIQLNTSSLFGIDASAYDLWQATQYPITGALTGSVLNDAVAFAVNKGGLDEEVVAFVNPTTWARLMDTALTAQRRFDSSYSQSLVKNGAEELVFYSQAGAIEIVAHPYVFEGDCMIIPLDEVTRVGSSDIILLTNQGTESNSTGSLLWPITGTLSYELRAFTDQAVLIRNPAKSVIITGIVNS